MMFGCLEQHLEQCRVFWHPPHVLPILLLGETHHVEDPVQLVVVVRVARLDVLLPAVENGLAGQKFGEDAADGPDINGLHGTNQVSYDIIRYNVYSR